MNARVTEQRLRMLMRIGAEEVPAASGHTLEIVNPATGIVTAEVARGGPEDVDRAVRAAKTAFEAGTWSGMSATDRGRVLLRLAGRIRDHAEDLTVLEVRHSGKTITDARGEVEGVRAQDHPRRRGSDVRERVAEGTAER